MMDWKSSGCVIVVKLYQLTFNPYQFAVGFARTRRRAFVRDARPAGAG